MGEHAGHRRRALPTHAAAPNTTSRWASRRANSVKEYLVSLGVPTNRVTVVSKGKEAPFCTEENEACWQQNRRGHFVITGK